MNEKSILEQALLQVQTLEEAVKQNAKGILASTMKQELSDLLKESLEEEEEVKVGDEEEAPITEQPIPDEEEKDDMSDDEDASADTAGADDAENVDDLDNEDPTKGIDSLDSEEGDDEVSDDTFEPSADDEMGSDDDDVMDMTGASDDEVLKVFKAMKPEDGIVVKKDGNQIEFGNGEDDYIIKLDSDDVADEVEEEEEMPAEVGGDSTEEAPTDETETLYEIELDEEEEEDSTEEETTESEDDTKEVEATEAARTKWNPHGDKGEAERTGLKSKKVFKAGSQINEEVETLKKQNAEYKKALVLFKEKLNEVAVFNANLAYATRLFTEHSTTKQEKINILRRFDNVETIKESKSLYKTLKDEFSSETTKENSINESFEKSVTKTPVSGSAVNLIESKTYENPQFLRMKDLMGKIK